MTDELLASLRDVSVRFGRGRKDKSAVTAVDGVSLDLVSGRTLGLVGESGSGKSTLARVVAGLQKPTGGSIHIHTAAKSARDRRREIQMVFQDPFSSLNPYMKVGSLIQEAWAIHPSAAPQGNRRSAAAEMLERVGLTEAHLDRRPHQLSGGQRQRVGIARALAARPRLLVCDEAVSALDVSVQAGVLNLFQDLQSDLDLSYLFISHDMAVIAHLSDEIAVMYNGELVEFGTRDAICYAPTHPYTAALIASARGERTEQVERL